MGVPQVHYFGQEGLHNVLVIDLLGPNLEDLFDMCGRKFTIKTVCMAAKQMVSVSLFLSPKNQSSLGRCSRMNAGEHTASQTHALALPICDKLRRQIFYTRPSLYKGSTFCS